MASLSQQRCFMRQLVSGAKFQIQVQNNCEILQDATLRLNVAMKEELRNERGNERFTKICCLVQKCIPPNPKNR